MIWITLLIIGVLIGVYFLFFCKKKPKEQSDNDYHNDIIPPEPKKVSEELQDTGFMLSSLSVFEDFWCTRITESSLKKLLDDFAEKGVGNWSRSFLFPASPWQYKYKNWFIPIFKKQGGLYQLPKPWNAQDTIGDFINPDFLGNVLRVIKEKTAREIGVMISLWDNCGFHSGVPWNHNFLNPVNNNIGKHLSDHRHAYHLYADKPDNEKMQNTGLIVEALTRYMLEYIYDNLTLKQREYIAIEACNEGNAGLEDMNNKLWTSSSADDLKKISVYFRPIAHKVGTIKKFKQISKNQYVYGISTDGWKDSTGEYARMPVPGDRMAQILTEAYSHGFTYLETLNGHRQEETRLPGGRYNTTINKMFYDFSAIRWGEMKEVANRLLELSRGKT